MHGGRGCVYVGVYVVVHVCLHLYVRGCMWLHGCVYIDVCVCACIWYIWKDICLSKEPSFPCKTAIIFISLQLPLGGMETVFPWRSRVRLPVPNLWKWTNNRLTPKVMENYQAQKMKLTRWVCVCVRVMFPTLLFFFAPPPTLAFFYQAFYLFFF